MPVIDEVDPVVNDLPLNLRLGTNEEWFALHTFLESQEHTLQPIGRHSKLQQLGVREPISAPIITNKCSIFAKYLHYCIHFFPPLLSWQPYAFNNGGRLNYTKYGLQLLHPPVINRGPLPF